MSDIPGMQTIARRTERLVLEGVTAGLLMGVGGAGLFFAPVIHVTSGYIWAMAASCFVGVATMVIAIFDARRTD